MTANSEMSCLILNDFPKRHCRFICKILVLRQILYMLSVYGEEAHVTGEVWRHRLVVNERHVPWWLGEGANSDSCVLVALNK